MCWKRKPIIPVPPMDFAERRLLSFAINDYPGNTNDLRGCLNDSRQVKDTLLTHWPDFDIRRYLDSEATLKAFKTNVASAIAVLKPGATVVILADSCFSATITRLIQKRGVEELHIPKNRFYATPGEPVRTIARPFLRADLRWIVISGCGETQYSADAFINDAYHGAFTWFAMRLLRQGITYRRWFAEIRQYLPSTDFDQIPTIEGPELLLDSLVCSNNTLFIHNSTHGTQLNGIAEEDIDEAICFFDGNLRDNEYFDLLNKIE